MRTGNSLDRTALYAIYSRGKLAGEDDCQPHSGAGLLASYIQATRHTFSVNSPTETTEQYGRCWARTSDLRLVEAALSQLS